MKKRLRFFLPLGIFIALAVFLGIGLGLNPREVPSPLINKPVPQFELPRLDDPSSRFQPSELAGEVWVLNVWASWCVSCRAEHDVLKALVARNPAPIVGLNYKDEVADARRWLDRLGDPYALSVVDAEGQVGIDWGVYGVPETFVIDGDGMIRYKHIGPVDMDDIEQKLLPILQQLQSGES